MKTFLALLLVIGAFASYLVLALGFGVFQHYPVLNYAAALAGVGWLALLLRQRFTWRRATAFAFSVLVAGLFFWWTLGFSEYEKREHRAAAGENIAALAELQLPDATGATRALFQGGEKAVLLVFYRGYW